AAGSVAVRVAALNNETGDDTVESQTVIKSSLCQLDEIAGCDWRVLLKEAEFDRTLVCLYYCCSIPICHRFASASNFLKDEFIDCFGYTVFIITCSSRKAEPFQTLLSICHYYRKSGVFEHLDIVVIVSYSHYSFPFYAKRIGQTLQPRSL